MPFVTRNLMEDVQLSTVDGGSSEARNGTSTVVCKEEIESRRNTFLIIKKYDPKAKIHYINVIQLTLR